jgi:hypothetical protein
MLTANVVAAHFLFELANQLRALVEKDQKVEGWDPVDHCLTHDAKAIENIAFLILLDTRPQTLINAMAVMDTTPQQQVYGAIPEPVWNSLGITMQVQV